MYSRKMTLYTHYYKDYSILLLLTPHSYRNWGLQITSSLIKGLKQFPPGKQNTASSLTTVVEFGPISCILIPMYGTYVVSLLKNSCAISYRLGLQACHICLFILTKSLDQILIIQQLPRSSIDCLNPSYFPGTLTPCLVPFLFHVQSTAHSICTQMLPVI